MLDALSALPANATPGPPSLEDMAHLLSTSDQYRVLRRFRRRDRYTDDDNAPKRNALFVDVETTGLDHRADAIIEFAAVPFEYGTRDGRVYAVGNAVTYFEDPGCLIPPRITALTGITNGDVRGQAIDDARIAELTADAHLVVAHNAAFDRPFLERRLPVFGRLPWACSYAEVPWAQHGCQGRALETLLWKHCGEFFDGHRAAEDCYAGVHVLATPLPCGTVPFTLLLTSARRPTVRLWAHNTHPKTKDIFRSRGYRWHPGDAQQMKAWYRDVALDDAEAEGAWLDTKVYVRAARGWQSQTLTAYDRYSDTLAPPGISRDSRVRARLCPHPDQAS